MEPKSTVIVPVDYLKHTDDLIAYAAFIAEKLSAVLHFIHVIDFYSGNAVLGAPLILEVEEAFLTDAQTRMDCILSENKKECPDCSGSVVSGDPAEQIVEQAKMRQAELIIISTHGGRGFNAALLGSVARGVLKGAHCPVLILNPSSFPIS